MVGPPPQDLDWKKYFIFTHKLSIASKYQEQNYKIGSEKYKFPSVVPHLRGTHYVLLKVDPSNVDSCCSSPDSYIWTSSDCSLLGLEWIGEMASIHTMEQMVTQNNDNMETYTSKCCSWFHYKSDLLLKPCVPALGSMDCCLSLFFLHFL